MKNRKILIVITAIALSVLVSLIIFRKPDSNSTVVPLNNIEYFKTSKSVYEDGSFSYVVNIENMPTYVFTEDLRLCAIDANSLVTELGTMEEITLEKENFDTRLTKNYWIEDFSTKDFKKNNQRAWQLLIEDQKDRYSDLYMLFEQEDGTYYLGIGYYNSQSVEPKNKDDSFIRWIYEVSPVTVKEPLENLTAEADGRLFYYKEPTAEYFAPEIVRYNDFEKSQLEEFFKKAKALKWVYDGLVDRTGFNFDGYIVCGEYKIFFGYENNILYCNEYFATANEEIFSYTKTLRETAKENNVTFSETYNYYYQTNDGSVTPTLKLNYINNSFTFTWSPLSSYLAVGHFEINNGVLICKTADAKNIYTFVKEGENFVFDAKRSSAINIFKSENEPDKTEGTVPDGAVFKVREINKTNGVTNITATYD